MEVKHIMIMIIAIIYIFLSYVIFDQQLKITFRKSSGPPEKVHPPLFTHSPRKIQKVQVPPFLPTLKIFQPPPLQKGGGGGHLWLYHIQNPQASSKVCRTWMMIMHIQGPSIEQYIQAFLRIFRNIFRDINAYSATLTGMQLRVRGEAPLPFLKIEKSVLILGRKVLIISIFGLNFLFKM